MMNDSLAVSESKGLRQPIQRGGMLQSLMLPITVAILALGITAAVCGAEAQHSDEAAQDHGDVESVQTECPVMVGNKIDPSLYVDYKGKRVFLCCKFCQQAFRKNPEKYLDKLPQFNVGASKAHDDAADDHQKNVADPKTRDDAADGQHKHDHADGDQHLLARLISFAGRFHATAVHFPIALLIAAAVAELLAVFASTSKSLFLNASRFAIFVGALGGIGATLLGWATGASASYPAEFSLTFNLHRWTGTSAGLAIVVCAILCELSYRRDNAALRAGYRVALALSVVLISLTGYLGGTLVYGLNHYTW